ncbi:nucleopolyhedrovirus P10 family protein [Streptomyces sp. BV286]|uniref:nucleopolyhedrovirus P10 family protein n=1 Tax=Streptomyces sp. BV286 TaxID=2849672 RepID=UPI001C2E3EAA|nr:nucleopolyhedrovirus P10 family protein [Streptomyces sp. BV286]MBV1936984.1 nucleopolyhedrovirus P10 family protein [Streptomyces sp. BV286]
MTADRWTQAVRHQIGLGRLLPLGGAHDGAWITEAAATSVLRRAVRQVPGVRLDALRLSLTDPDDASEPAVPAPPSALPPGPLRITAEFAAPLTPDEPLPMTASRLRAALASTATDRLGLSVTEVDLRVTGLLEDGADPALPAEPDDARPDEPHPAPDTDEARVSAAALSVPGVTALSRKARVEERHADTALPRRHVLVEIRVGTAGRALDVARAVRAKVTEALPDHPSVAVLVTAVSPGS